MGINNNPWQPGSGGSGEDTFFAFTEDNNGWWNPTTPAGVAVGDTDLQIQTVNNDITRACLLRIPGFNYAQGTVLSAAVLDIYGGATQVGGGGVAVPCADVDDFTMPADGTAANAIPLTTAIGGFGTLTTDVLQSIDVTAPVNEVLARAGFVGGNGIGFLFFIGPNLIGRTKSIRAVHNPQIESPPILRVSP